MPLSEKIVSLRKSKGMTQDDLSTVLGISRQSISKWESGQAVPDISNVTAMAKAFGVSTDYLIMDEEETSAKTTEATPLHSPEKRKKKWMLPAIAAAAVVVVFVLLFATGILGRNAGDEEMNAAINLGIVPEDMQGSYDQPATEREIYAVLSTAVQKRFNTVSEKLMERYSASTNRTLTREQFSYVLYRTDVWENRGLQELALAAEFEIDWAAPDAQAVLQATEADFDVMFDEEIGGFAASYTEQARAYRDSLPEGQYINNEVKQWHNINEKFNYGKDLSEAQQKARGEQQHAYIHGWHVIPVEFCQVQRSTISGLPLMEQDKAGNFRTKDAVTRAEVIRAAYRLFYTW